MLQNIIYEMEVITENSGKYLTLQVSGSAHGHLQLTNVLLNFGFGDGKRMLQKKNVIHKKINMLQKREKIICESISLSFKVCSPETYL